jgi:hypothetical protein
VQTTSNLFDTWVLKLLTEGGVAYRCVQGNMTSHQGLSNEGVGAQLMVTVTVACALWLGDRLSVAVITKS